MTEDNRFLPFFLRELVYVIAEPEKVAEGSPAPSLSVVGLGTKGILVLVHDAEHAFLSPDNRHFLEKILQAVNLSADDIALINWHAAQPVLQAGIALKRCLPAEPYATTIVFGEVPTPWSQSNFFEKYAVNRDGSQRFLQADALEVLRESPEQKLLLWKCLQQLFL